MGQVGLQANHDLEPSVVLTDQLEGLEGDFPDFEAWVVQLRDEHFYFPYFEKLIGSQHFCQMLGCDDPDILQTVQQLWEVTDMGLLTSGAAVRTLLKSICAVADLSWISVTTL